MRPPLITGENDHRRGHVIVGVATSMRPPLITGENPWESVSAMSVHALQ